MKAKHFLEHQIKSQKKSIERQERDFDEIVSSSDKDYGAIIQCAMAIKTQKDELYGMQKALEAMEMCEEQEDEK